MATIIYETKYIHTMDNIEIEISPLKIKYLRQLMDVFENIKSSNDDDESMDVLVNCARVCMKQHHPALSKSKEDIEDNFDLPTIYEILRVCAGININKSSTQPVKAQAIDNGTSWTDFDLVALESEVFLLGIWTDYSELEKSLCIAELNAILKTKREADYEEKKFMAAIQGIDLEKNNKEQDAWTKLKNKVFNEGRDDNDILTFKGDKAVRAGFGIGMGLDYEQL